MSEGINFNPPEGFFQPPKQDNSNNSITEKAKREIHDSMNAINESFGFLGDRLGQPIPSMGQEKIMPQVKMPNQKRPQPTTAPAVKESFKPVIPIVDVNNLTEEQLEKMRDNNPQNNWTEKSGESTIDPALNDYVLQRMEQLKKENPESVVEVQKQEQPQQTAMPRFNVQPEKHTPPPASQAPQQGYSYQVDPRYQKEHPILSKLKEKIGLRALPTYKLEIEDNENQMLGKFTLRALTDEMAAWTVRAAEFTSAGAEENLIKFRIAIGAASVITIDGVPIYEVMKVDVSDYAREDIDRMHKEPSYFPPALHKESARRLLALFLNELPGVGQKVYEAYAEKIDPKTVLNTSVDKENKLKIRWSCPIGGCKVEYFEIPTPSLDEKKYRPKFCKEHGAEMVVISDSEREADLPLL